MFDAKRIYLGLMARLFTRMGGGAHKQRGASALEYIVLAVVVVLVVAAGAALISGNVDQVWTDIGNALTSDGGGEGG